MKTTQNLGCGIVGCQIIAILMTIWLYALSIVIIVWSFKVSPIYGIVAIGGLATQILPLVIFFALVLHVFGIV